MPRSRSFDTTSPKFTAPMTDRVRTVATRSAPGSSFSKQSRAEASRTILLLMLSLRTPVSN
ncbi:hypothetical protein ASE91_09080 [Sphingomonas sp. Leaf62]|nr:hypothetical protein ASE91_09080 [Sphingomonas sp. Leaf62]